MFNSAVVAVTPSMMFNSAVVAVTPSMMFNSAAVAVRPSVTSALTAAASSIKDAPNALMVVDGGRESVLMSASTSLSISAPASVTMVTAPAPPMRASTVSQFVFVLVPHVVLEAPFSGFTRPRFVVVVSAM